MEISYYPSLYQINTRVRHRRLLSQVDQAVGIDGWPDNKWRGIAKQGFD
ncbi:hypothetical protein [Nitrosomonas sp.]|nr:hypothetical protein [Nitrosomonas sp.]MCW5602872.1 hypothetical protein [Nitrosomonas sp.]